MWSLSLPNRLIHEHLAAHDALLTNEQAVRGLDSLREIDMHPLIAQSFTSSPTPAIREICFPSTERESPGRNARERVDLVLLPEGKKSLYDPVDAHKQLLSATGTLFETVAERPKIKSDECDPSDALWIEIKVIPQIRYVDGVPIANAKYAHEILAGPSEDVVKLAADPLIRHAAILIVLFNEEQEAGPHDLAMGMREMIDRDLPVGMPDIEQFPILDRCGNVWCTLGMVPVRL